MQQKPTMSGVRVTSPARHAGRILTGPLRLPSRWRLAHRTSALAVTAKRSTPTSDARTRVGLGADSDGSRTGVPIEAEHPFRRKPNTRSDRSRTLIPSEAEHPAV